MAEDEQGASGVVLFDEVFRQEMDVVNFRRKALKEGGIERMRSESNRTSDQAASPAPAASTFLRERETVRMASTPEDAKAKGTVRIGENAKLTGIALSGGGVRAAAFSLGVLQALDSLTKYKEPSVLDAVDYLSTVSGGGYIGASLINSLAQPDHRFPFDSRLDEQETPQTKHLRNYSNFLAPNGAVDYLTSIALVVRGFLVNLIIVAPLLLFAAFLTIAIAPTCSHYGRCVSVQPIVGQPPSALFNFAPLESPSFEIALAVGGLIALLTFATAIYNSLFFSRGSLQTRAGIGFALAIGLMIVFASVFISLQPFVIGHIAAYLIGGVGSPLGHWLAGLTGTLAALAAAISTVAPKLASMSKASTAKGSWSSFAKKVVGKAGLLLASVIAPLLLWAGYVFLAAVAVQGLQKGTCGIAARDWVQRGCGNIPSWLIWERIGPVASAYFTASIILAIVCLVIGPNANSLHRLYRDRLSKAFLIDQSTSVSDKRRFSELKTRDANSGWDKHAAVAPYFIANTAINLIGSEELNKRGRNADNFIFSPLFAGSAATGYVASKAIEAVVKDLTLGTVMATSGAAASANMGANTLRPLTFSLSLLNIRLGYWLANPKRLVDFGTGWKKILANIGTVYFAAEAVGKLDENFLNVYLTDGGHCENLGIYELLKRRCSVIVAVDAEADPDLTFPSLINLEVMARIDLGIRIDLNWREISERSRNVMKDLRSGDDTAVERKGPHVAVGVIRYSETETGTLIYIKSSVTGDENDYIVDYQRKNTTFPHETTVDQFFTEKQFEAYRSLGFHAARGFFSGDDVFAGPSARPADLAKTLTDSLALLNIPQAMADRVVENLR